MTKSEAGRLGQQALRNKLGDGYSAWMAKIGRMGAAAFYKRYTYVPVERNNFAIVDRSTGETVNTLLGRR